MNDFEHLRQNYLEMDESGREKLEEVSEKILEIHEITESDSESKTWDVVPKK